jgi:hypothetical protein
MCLIKPMVSFVSQVEKTTRWNSLTSSPLLQPLLAACTLPAMRAHYCSWELCGWGVKGDDAKDVALIPCAIN